MGREKVLLIDGDPQGTLTISLGNPQSDKLPVTLSDMMGKVLTDQPIASGGGILHHPESVDLMPADILLSDMEVSLVNAISRETVLQQYLDTVKGPVWKKVARYAKTAEELYEEVKEAKQQIEDPRFRRTTPAIAEYCERFLIPAVSSSRNSSAIIGYNNFPIHPLYWHSPLLTFSAFASV